MPFFYSGNGYFEDSYITNTSVNNVYLNGSVIKTSSIDMLTTSGNYGNILNVAIPINNYDAVPKIYVDNLNINVLSATLTGTASTTVTPVVTSGSYIVTVYGGTTPGSPFGVWNISKNSNNVNGHIVRTNLTPGISTSTLLNLDWPALSGVRLFKNDNNYNGVYTVKFV